MWHILNELLVTHTRSFSAEINSRACVFSPSLCLVSERGLKSTMPSVVLWWISASWMSCRFSGVQVGLSSTNTARARSSPPMTSWATTWHFSPSRPPSRVSSWTASPTTSTPRWVSQPGWTRTESVFSLVFWLLGPKRLHFCSEKQRQAERFESVFGWWLKFQLKLSGASFSECHHPVSCWRKWVFRFDLFSHLTVSTHSKMTSLHLTVMFFCFSQNKLIIKKRLLYDYEKKSACTGPHVI